MKKLMSILLTVCMLLSLAACAGSSKPQDASAEEPAQSTGEETAPEGEDAAPEAENEKKYKIGFSAKTLTNEPFIAYIADGIKGKVESLGHEFVLMTTSTSSDVAQQVSQLEDMINSGVDAIILDPLDSQAVLPSVEKAKDKGIPVVWVDTPPVEGTEDLYITYIGTDNYAAAAEAGRAMAEALNGSGKVVIVRSANGNTTSESRANGFKAGLEGSGVEVVAEQPGNWTNDDALQAMENMCSADPDIDGVWSCADGMLDGILQAIQNNPNVKEDIVIYSFDGSMKGCQLIEDGKIKGSIAQYPDVMGEIAVETIIQVLNGEKQDGDFEKFIDSGSGMVDASNYEEAMKTAY